MKIQGFGGGGKGGGGSQHTPVEAPDSIHSKAYARVVDVIGEGEIEGLVNGLQSILLDGVPVLNSDGSSNFTGVSIYFRNGTQQQDFLPGFSAAENEVNVATAVKQTTPIVRSITDTTVDAIRVTIGTPGLTTTNKSTGDITGASFQYKIEVADNSGNFIPQVLTWTPEVQKRTGNIQTDKANAGVNSFAAYMAYLADQNVITQEAYNGCTIATVSGKTTTKYQRSHRIQLSGTGPWQIRVTRVTPDSTDSAVQNAMTWDSYTEIVDAKLSYPNTAICGVSVDASQFSSVPTRGYDCKLLKIQVPSNYDPVARTYSGVWDGSFKVAWSDNPAWCFYDLVTNTRYGLGDYVDAAQVDKWALYTIGQYCDELVADGFGGQEPRFTLNTYLQTQEDAIKLLSDLASVFRGMAFWASGAMTASQDAPKDAVYLYNQSNVIDGTFVYQGSALTSRHTAALVTWNNPGNLYKQEIEYVEDQEAIAKYGFFPVQVNAIGCTSRGQAHRVGRWILLSEQTEADTVTFQTGLDGAVVRPGQIIKVADPNRAGKRLGGRVHSATTDTTANTTTVNLDAPVTIDTVDTFTLAVLNSKGQAEEQTLTINPGAYSSLTVSPAFADTPRAESIWILSSASVEAQLFRVVNITELDRNKFEITGLSYNPSKFDAVDTGTQLEQKTISAISLKPAQPTNLTVSEFLYETQTTVEAGVTLSVDPLTNGESYLFSYKVDDNNWVQLPETTVHETIIRNAVPGNYIVRCASKNSLGNVSPAIFITQTIQGKTAAPADITGLAFTLANGLLHLAWGQVPDLDVQVGGAIIVRFDPAANSTAWDTSSDVGRTAGSASNITLPIQAGTYMVKALDSSGVYSVNLATVNVAVNMPSQVIPVATVQNDAVNFAWDPTVSTLPLDAYELRYGANFAASTLLARLKSNGYKCSVNWLGSRTFWLVAYDVMGNASPESSVQVNIAIPSQVVMSAGLDSSYATLSWTAAASELSLDQYEVRYGANWDAGTRLTSLKSNSYKLPVSWVGDRTFWVAGIDIAGNYGTPASVTVTIKVPDAPVVSTSIVVDQAIVSWTAPGASLPIDQYEVRYGSDWASGTSIGLIKANTLKTIANWVNSRTFMVAAIDVNGNYGAPGSASVHIDPPIGVSLTQQVIDNYVLLKWTDATATLPIDHYQVAIGDTYAGATVLGNLSGRFTTLFESASGNYTFWVTAFDTAGNAGPPVSVTAYVNQPPDYVLYYDFNSDFVGYGAVNTLTNGQAGALLSESRDVITHPGADGWSQAQAANGYSSGKHYWECILNPSVLDNAVMYGISQAGDNLNSYPGYTANGYGYDRTGNLYHNGSAPAYGQSFTTSDVIGVALDMDAGTLTFYKNGESQGVAATGLTGSWFPAVGMYRSGDVVTVNFGASPFAFQCPEGYNGRSSIAQKPEDGTLIAPVNIVESYQDHFNNHSWSTGQDQVNAGYPFFVEPSSGVATYTEILDYGTTLAASLIAANLTSQALAGSPSVSCKISYKLNWSDAWTDFDGVWSAYATNFRYVKITLTITGGATDILSISGLNIKLNVKLRNDAGSGNANAADANGTQVNFNVPFIDVQSITVTSQGTTPVTAVYNFNDVPNPTGFQVYLFDSNGNRVSGPFSWSAKGA